jgi:molecular chaperone DnaK
MGGVSTKLIDRNTTIPTQRSQTFSTAADNQTQVEIHITPGERAMANDNKSLGRFILDSIPPAPRGMPQIEVSFDVDANGILNVTAKDKASGKEQSIKIEATSGLSDSDIETMQKDAEEHEKDDQAKRELVEAKNVAEQLAYTAEKSLKDHADKIDEETKKEVEEKTKALRSAIDGTTVDPIKTASDELSTVMQKIGEAVAKHESENKDTKGETSKEGEENKEDNKKDDDEGKVRDAETE